MAAGAIVFMPLLAGAKGRVAAQLGSAATAGDAAQSWLCAISAAAVLLSILANVALGGWWPDPIAGLGIAGLAVREGREAWAGEVCSDCAPIGFESAESDGCAEEACREISRQGPSARCSGRPDDDGEATTGFAYACALPSGSPGRSR